MKNLTAILFALFAAFSASGCAEQPGTSTNTNTSTNTQDQQRAHAEKAQGELSSEVRK